MSINGFVDQHGQVQKYNYDELDNKPTDLNQFDNGPGFITGIADHSINENKLTSALAAIIENASFYSNAAIDNITHGNLNQKIKVNPFVIRTSSDLYGTIRVNRTTAVINQNGSITFTPVTSTNITDGFWIEIANDTISSHKVYISVKGLSTTRPDFVKWRIFVSQSGERYLTDSIEFTESNYSIVVNFTTLDATKISVSLLEVGSQSNSSNTSFTLGSMQVIDLTEMFGAGLEPSLEEFEAVYGTGMPYTYRIPEIVEDLKDEKVLALSVINSIINNNNDQSIIYRGRLTDADDLHNLEHPGMYFVATDYGVPDNFPYENPGSAIVLVIKPSATNNHWGETHYVMGTTSLWIERCTNGGTNWTGWKRLSDSDELETRVKNSSISYQGILTSADDLHNLSYPGMYYIRLSDCPANFPYTGSGGVRLLVNKSSTTNNHLGETHFVMGDTSLWVERSINESGTNWTGWKRLSDANDIYDSPTSSFSEIAKSISSSYPHDLASGLMPSFSDGAENSPVKETTIFINPFQKGFGDPSINNTRELSGYSQIELNHSRRNLWPGASNPDQNPKNNVTITSFNNEGFVRIQTSEPASDLTFSKRVNLNLRPGVYKKTPLTNGVGVYVQYIFSSSSWNEVPGGHMTSDKFIITEEIANNYQLVVRISVNSGTYIPNTPPFGYYDYFPYIYKIDDYVDKWELATITKNTFSIPSVLSSSNISGVISGGNINLTNGMVNVTHAKFHLGDLTWTTGVNDEGLNYFIGSGLETEVPRVPTSKIVPSFLSSNYKVVSAEYLYHDNLSEDVISIVGNWATYDSSKGKVWIIDSRYTDGSVSGDEFKAILQSSAAEISFEFICTIEDGIAPKEVKTFLGYNAFWTNCGSIKIDYNADSTYYLEKERKANEYLMLNIHTKPKNNGVLNAIKRARQLTDIKWVPIASIKRGFRETSDTYASSHGDTFIGTFAKDKEYVGFPYTEYKYIGTDYAIDCFATGIRNTNSAEIIESNLINPPSNSACYYGTNCVGLVGYALDIPVISSANYPSIRYFTNLGYLNHDGNRYPVSSLELCDVLQISGHVAIITDIIENGQGEIISIEISESTRQGNPVRFITDGPYGGRCRRILMSVEEFYKWFEDFIVLRYNQLETIKYTPNKYSPMVDEAPCQAYLDMPCIPYEGNMCSYANPTGNSPEIKNVTILIKDPNQDYTHIQVFKDDILFGEYSIENLSSIDIPCGKEEAIYTAKLIKYGANSKIARQSISCTWAIRPYMSLYNTTIDDNMVHFIMRNIKPNEFKPWYVKFAETSTVTSSESAEFYRIDDGEYWWRVNQDGTVNYHFDIPYTDSSKQYVRIGIRSEKFGTGSKTFSLPTV